MRHCGAGSVRYLRMADSGGAGLPVGGSSVSTTGICQPRRAFMKPSALPEIVFKRVADTAREQAMPCNRVGVNTVREHDQESVVEFETSKGRLRFLRNKKIVAELLPPHSWTFVASVANNEHWGTRPSREDLAVVLRAFVGIHSVMPLEEQPSAREALYFMSTGRGSTLRRVLSKCRDGLEIVRRLLRRMCVAD